MELSWYVSVCGLKKIVFCYGDGLRDTHGFRLTRRGVLANLCEVHLLHRWDIRDVAHELFPVERADNQHAVGVFRTKLAESGTHGA